MDNEDIISSDSDVVEDTVVEDTQPEEISLRDELDSKYDELSDNKDINDQAEGGSLEVPAEPVIEPVLEPIDVPHSWSSDAKQKWDTVPRELQEVIAAREKDSVADYTRKTQEAADMKRQADAVLSKLDPFKDAIAQKGVAPDEYIGQLLQADKMLEQNPVDALNFLAQSYTGKSLAELIGSTPNGGQTTYDPRVAELQNGISQMQSYMKAQEEQKAVQNFEKTTSFVENFYSKKDESGLPVFKHIENVKAEIPELINSLRSKNPKESNEVLLQKAYDQAVWLNPEVRVQMMQQEAQKKKQTAATARRSAGVKSSAPLGKGSIDTNGMTTRQTLEYFYENQ